MDMQAVILWLHGSPTVVAVTLCKRGLLPTCPELAQVETEVTCNLSWICNSRKRFCTLGYALHADLDTVRRVTSRHAGVSITHHELSIGLPSLEWYFPTREVL